MSEDKAQPSAAWLRREKMLRKFATSLAEGMTRDEMLIPQDVDLHAREDDALFGAGTPDCEEHEPKAVVETRPGSVGIRIEGDHKPMELVELSVEEIPPPRSCGAPSSSAAYAEEPKPKPEPTVRGTGPVDWAELRGLLPAISSPEVPGYRIVADTGPFPMKCPTDPETHTKPLRCRLGWHRWQRVVQNWEHYPSTDLQTWETVTRCTRCGKERT